jgi:AcrR family transcriptional regulator
MGTIERRQRLKDSIRNDILEAAWSLVSADGWEALSMRKIAGAIEYTAPVIYEHFHNKEALLLEFAKKGFRTLSAKVTAAKGSHRNPEKQLKAIADAYWDFAEQHSRLYQLMFGLGMPGCQITAAMPEQAKFRELVMEPMERLIDNSGRKMNSCLKYHAFWSVIHGLIAIKLMANPAIEGELNKQVLDDAIDSFIKNIS